MGPAGGKKNQVRGFGEDTFTGNCGKKKGKPMTYNLKKVGGSYGGSSLFIEGEFQPMRGQRRKKRGGAVGERGKSFSDRKTCRCVGNL